MPYNIASKMQTVFLWISCVISLCVSNVMGCLPGSLPVVQMCYNNTVTFDTTGFASVSKATLFQICHCTMTSHGEALRVEVTLSSSQSNCGVQIMTFALPSGFATTLDCSTGNKQRKIAVSNTTIQPITYKRNQPLDICVKFQILSGRGKMLLHCSGDDVPLATQTSSPIPTKSTRLTPSLTTTTTTTTKTQPSVASSTKNIELNTTTKEDIKSTKPIPTESLNMSTTPQSLTEILTTFYSSNETMNNTTTTEAAEKTSMKAITHTLSETTTVQNSSPDTSPEKDPKDLDGIIAGVVVASIVFVVLVAFLIVFLERRRRAQKRKKLHATSAGGATENPAFDDVTSNGYSIHDVEKKKVSDDVQAETKKENENVSKPTQDMEIEENDLYAKPNKQNKVELENADTLF